jgi:uncharacterized cupin superfamily protein
MFYPLEIANAYACSQTRPGASLLDNSYLLRTDAGNVLVDPLPFDDATHRQIDALGGVERIVVLTAERRATADQLAARRHSAVVETAEHRATIAPGLTAIRLQHQRRADEFALNLRDARTVITGDAFVGAPAGALSMGVDFESDAGRQAALGLRAILRENPERLLVSRGQSIYANAYDALYRLLYAKAGAEVHRINVDELDFRDDRDEHDEQPEQFACIDAEVGWAIGARGLGYRVSTLAPGHRFCPLHGHAREEELFYVIAGTPSVRTLSGTLRCRPGDFIALPVGESGTHQLLNDSDAPATVLLLARNEPFEACYYPDSDKLLVDMPAPLDGRNSILIAAHPQLDYFTGES